MVKKQHTTNFTHRTTDHTKHKIHKIEIVNKESSPASHPCETCVVYERWWTPVIDGVMGTRGVRSYGSQFHFSSSNRFVFQVKNLLSSKMLHCNVMHQYPFISCFQNITYFVFKFGLIWCNPHYSISEKFLNFDSLCKIFDIMRITKKKPLFENPTTHFPGPGRQHRSQENSLPGICWNLLLENSFSGATDTLGWLLNLPTGCLANPVWGPHL